VRLLGAGLALSLFFVPRERDAVRTAALMAAVLIVTELGSGYWTLPYAAWFTPPLLVALLARDAGLSGGSTSATSSSGPTRRSPD
jgi:hypothetical protein